MDEVIKMLDMGALRQGGRCLRAIWYLKDISVYERIILIYLGSILDFTGDFSEGKAVSKETIAKTTGISKRTAIRSVNQLIKKGYLTQILRKIPSQKKHDTSLIFMTHEVFRPYLDFLKQKYAEKYHRNNGGLGTEISEDDLVVSVGHLHSVCETPSVVSVGHHHSVSETPFNPPSSNKNPSNSPDVYPPNSAGLVSGSENEVQKPKSKKLVSKKTTKKTTAKKTVKKKAFAKKTEPKELIPNVKPGEKFPIKKKGGSYDTKAPTGYVPSEAEKALGEAWKAHYESSTYQQNKEYTIRDFAYWMHLIIFYSDLNKPEPNVESISAFIQFLVHRMDARPGWPGWGQNLVSIPAALIMRKGSHKLSAAWGQFSPFYQKRVVQVHQEEKWAEQRQKEAEILGYMPPF